MLIFPFFFTVVLLDSSYHAIPTRFERRISSFNVSERLLSSAIALHSQTVAIRCVTSSRGTLRPYLHFPQYIILHVRQVCKACLSHVNGDFNDIIRQH